MWLTDELVAPLRSSRRRFTPGKFLFHRGDSVRAVHCILEGEVHLVRHQTDGTSVVLQRASPGAILAEASLFADRYHCDAVAVVPTVTASFDKRRLRARLTEDRQLAEVWASHLAREVQSTRLRAEILSLKTVAQRVDAWLAAADQGFPPKGEWKHVAAEIGTSPEALYRELARRRNRERSRQRPANASA